ncbi:hypothetical protein NS220_09135 [Microbacterium testaceum]|uniref:Polyketide cyclase n=1 Tax=Microbacterium testaceum TaxID=2033 RepID=A0A147EX32_MICTE|nr:hypothetical protein [Microbacterium testaceum]KTR94482.1 hypothetical protein NS220_09135 [Microbacterium testaceum]
MTTWRRQYTHLTTASPEAVWKRWTTPEDWVVDDPDLRVAEFAVPARVGAAGRVINHGTPAQTFTFTELQPGVAMNFRIRLPGAVLSLPHHMRPTANGLSVTHGVEVSGPLAFVLGPLVGRKIAAGLPAVVRLVTTNALGDMAAE